MDMAKETSEWRRLIHGCAKVINPDLRELCRLLAANFEREQISGDTGSDPFESGHTDCCNVEWMVLDRAEREANPALVALDTRNN